MATEPKIVERELELPRGPREDDFGQEGFRELTPSLFRELVAADVDSDVVDFFFTLPFSKDFVLSKWNESQIRIMLMRMDVATLEFMMSRPPPWSRFVCSPEGNARLTWEQIRALHLIRMLFEARLRRGDGGFEREAQVSQVHINRSEGMMTPAGRTGMWSRFSSRLAGRTG